MRWQMNAVSKKGEIQDTFRKVLAFVRNFDKTCRRPVTREDCFKRQRWESWDLQAIKQDLQRRAAEKEKAAAAAIAGAAEEEDDIEDKSSSSSSSSRRRRRRN